MLKKGEHKDLHWRVLAEGGRSDAWGIFELRLASLGPLEETGVVGRRSSMETALGSRSRDACIPEMLLEECSSLVSNSDDRVSQ